MKIFFNSLAVLAAAAYTGLLITVGLGFGPYWSDMNHVDILDWFNNKFFVYIGPVFMATFPPAFLATIVSVVLAWGNKEERKRWLYALGAILIPIVVTAVYHLPILDRFATEADTLTSEEVHAALSAWLTGHWLRPLGSLLAAIAGLWAMRAGYTGAARS